MFVLLRCALGRLPVVPRLVRVCGPARLRSRSRLPIALGHVHSTTSASGYRPFSSNTRSATSVATEVSLPTTDGARTLRGGRQRPERGRHSSQSLPLTRSQSVHLAGVIRGAASLTPGDADKGLANPAPKENVPVISPARAQKLQVGTAGPTGVFKGISDERVINIGFWTMGGPVLLVAVIVAFLIWFTAIGFVLSIPRRIWELVLELVSG